MAELFMKIIEGGYYQPFGGLSPEQERCSTFTQEHIDELLCARQREKYTNDVKVCVCGFGPADEAEPMDLSNFSQTQFFDPYMELVFYVDKFDFIVLCVAHGVCKVAEGFEERYIRTLLTALTFKHIFIPEKPDHVLDLRQPTTPRITPELPRTDAEKEAQLTSYVTRRRSFANQLRDELHSLETEQFEVERARGDHPTLFGWDKPPAAEVE